MSDLPPEAVEAMVWSDSPEGATTQERCEALLRAAIATGRVAVVPAPEERIELVVRVLCQWKPAVGLTYAEKEALRGQAEQVLAALGLDGEARDG